MKPTIVKHLTALILLFWAGPTFAAQDAPDWLVDGMYGSGKINTVVLVMAAVVLGIGGWLFNLDRRLGKLEKHK